MIEPEYEPVVYPEPVYCSTKDEKLLLYHKLWEYGMDDVGKPSVLNLNSNVEGTLFGEFQSMSVFQEDEIKLLPVV